MSDDATLNIEFNEADREYLRTGYELLISDPEGHSTRFPVLTGEVTLGGQGERAVDIKLDASGLANRQATFHFRQGGLFFTNLEPSLPIMVNGVNSTFAPLKDGDQLSFQGYHLTVFHLDKKLATLEACTEPYTGHLWGVEEQPVTIGRGTGKRNNTLDLNDRTVSRAHATIKHEAGRFTLYPDTDSSPIRVNGDPAKKPTVLGNGALLQLGQQLLRPGSHPPGGDHPVFGRLELFHFCRGAAPGRCHPSDERVLFRAGQGAVGVGINSGEVMVGDVGFTGKFEFAAMGDNTNLAARVEKLTRQMGCRIIITASTRAGLGPHYRLRELGATTVKGRQTPVQLDGVDGRID